MQHRDGDTTPDWIWDIIALTVLFLIGIMIGMAL